VTVDSTDDAGTVDITSGAPQKSCKASETGGVARSRREEETLSLAAGSFLGSRSSTVTAGQAAAGGNRMAGARR
jgi:hypothetical protein